LSKPLDITIIVPVYNRPEEVEELLESLSEQSNKNFKVIIVEDGSSIPCQSVVNAYQEKLNIQYFSKVNSGPGQSRNFGFDKSSSDYCIFLDSDCVIPKQYFETVHSNLRKNYVDAFGGPDAAHKDFTNLQKAINYSMTSFFTTGGIRGGGENLDKFYPRSFNMGYSRAVYKATGGFSKLRFGEDIDMSIRILNKGFETRLIKEAFVYHKRRSNLRQFFKQVYNSGIARINLHKRHCLACLLLSAFGSAWFALPLLLYILAIFIDSSIRNKNPLIGLGSIATSFVQLFGYGSGFLVAVWKRLILGKSEFAAFENTFYD